MFVSRYCSIALYMLLNLKVLCQGQRLSDSLAYPEDEKEDLTKQNAQYKSPVFLAGLCKTGEILYPGDQLDDWVCDCKPAYIYHPLTDRCYPAYRRGPCGPGESLILPRTRGTPICQQNSCTRDNYVNFRGECHEFDKPGPCMLPEIWNVVDVNETSLEIICSKDYKINNVALHGRPSFDVVNGEAATQMVFEIPDNPHLNHAGDTAKKAISEIPDNPHLNHAGDTAKKTISETPDNPNPIVNGTIYIEKKCFIGGKRWLQNKCPGQNSNNYNNQHSNSDTQLEMNKKIQDIFTIPSSA